MRRALVALVLVVSCITLSASEVRATDSSDTSKNIAEKASSLVNQYRQSNGLPPLVRVSTLDQAALLKAQNLASNGRFIHRDDVVKGVEYFANRAGYRLYDYRLLAENLACGPLLLKPGQIANAWVASEAHRENILHPTFSEYGIGIVRGNVNYNQCKSPEDIVLVMVFGGVM